MCSAAQANSLRPQSKHLHVDMQNTCSFNIPVFNSSTGSSSIESATPIVLTGRTPFAIAYSTRSARAVRGTFAFVSGSSSSSTFFGRAFSIKKTVNCTTAPGNARTASCEYARTNNSAPTASVGATCQHKRQQITESRAFVGRLFTHFAIDQDVYINVAFA
jgi:hypothetical protein